MLLFYVASSVNMQKVIIKQFLLKHFLELYSLVCNTFYQLQQFLWVVLWSWCRFGSLQIFPIKWYLPPQETTPFLRKSVKIKNDSKRESKHASRKIYTIICLGASFLEWYIQKPLRNRDKKLTNLLQISWPEENIINIIINHEKWWKPHYFWRKYPNLT